MRTYADSLKSVLVVLAAAGVFLSACASTTKSPGPAGGLQPGNSEVVLVRTLSEALWSAQSKRDIATVDSLLAPSFQWFSSRWPHGRNKSQELRFRFDVRDTLVSYDIQDVRAASVGAETLVLRYFIERRFRSEGKSWCPRSGVLETWAKKDGRWLQFTRSDWLVGALLTPECASQ